MSEKLAITEGDKVSIYFNHNCAEFDVEIIGIPYATGDSWKVKRSDGTIVYVQNFDKMVLNRRE